MKINYIVKTIAVGLALSAVITVTSCGKVTKVTQTKDEPQLEKLTANTDISTLAVGASVGFGNYEQDNNVDNGREVIEWKIIDITDTEVLLISKYGLDSQPFNFTATDIGWNDCSLRSWLNSDFYENAFDENECALIADSSLKNEPNSEYGTSSGVDTVDKVYILSVSEAKEYFLIDSSRSCDATKYALAQGVVPQENTKNDCWWWLRTSGCFGDYQTYVDYDGSIKNSGIDVSRKYAAIRPVVKVSLAKN